MLHDHGYKISEVDTVHRRFWHTLIDIEIDILQAVIYGLTVMERQINSRRKLI